jgi:NADP-dependent 3-hydroxy acid dehydrogenase YdfG
MMRTALVIGGSSGYGLGIARALRDAACSVFVASRTAPPDVSTFARHVELDVTDDRSVLEAFALIPSELDVVVYSAGKAIGMEHIINGSPNAWRDVFAVNTLGLMSVIKFAHERLRARGGLFVHIGSISNSVNYEGGADYCASKAAASSIMRTYRREALGDGVRTASIEPGLGATPFLVKRYDGDEKRARAHFDGVRELTPDDLGRVVVWLASQPPHVNIDEMIVKPLDQVAHGLTVRNRGKR